MRLWIFEAKAEESPRLYLRFWRFIFMLWPKERGLKKFEFLFRRRQPMRLWILFAAVVGLAACATAYGDGVADYKPAGWSRWPFYRLSNDADYSEDKFLRQALTGRNCNPDEWMYHVNVFENWCAVNARATELFVSDQLRRGNPVTEVIAEMAKKDSEYCAENWPKMVEPLPKGNIR